MSWDKEQIDELIKERSDLAVEVEQIAHELIKVNQENEELRLENERLRQEIQKRDEIQLKLGEQIGYVTETASALYHKFQEYKLKHYREKGLG